MTAESQIDERADLPTADDVVDTTVALTPARSTWRGTPTGVASPKGRPRSRRGVKDIALRIKDEWGDDNIGIAAAAVAFYGFMALIPALGALVSIVGLVARGQGATEVIDDLFGALPSEARDLLSDQLSSISESSSGSLSFGLIIGIVLSLWAASGAVGQLVNTINIAYDEEETRNWFVRRAMALGLTFGAIVFLALAIFSVVGLPLVIDRTGLGLGTRRLLNLAIWPGLALMFGVALAILYRLAPDRRSPRWRWVSPGATFAVAAWVVTTLGFRFYVSNFGSYNETYGSLAAVIVILLWLWLTAIIVLLGAELNAETEHQTAEDTTIDGDQPLGQRGAVKADTLGRLTG